MPNGTPNGNGRDKPLIGNTRGAKLTLSGIAAAIVGSGGVLIQKGFDEVTRIENLVTQHEIRNEHQDKQIADLKAEIVRLEQFLIEKLQIKLPE
jgi:hypothetical protein